MRQTNTVISCHSVAAQQRNESKMGGAMTRDWEKLLGVKVE
jgi:hypothetical protein